MVSHTKMPSQIRTSSNYWPHQAQLVFRASMSAPDSPSAQLETPIREGPTPAMSNSSAILPPLIADLQAVAARQPDAVAVIDERSEMSYGSFTRLVSARAQALERAGLQRGDRVALIAENSAMFLVSAFAVWEAGGVLVTVYPSTAPADLAYTLRDASPVAALADAATVDAVRSALPASVPVAVIDVADFTCASFGRDRLPNPTDLREPLFMICYSSGTTSRPKAIMLSHTALHHGATAYARVWRFNPSDKAIVCMPMAWLYGLCTTAMSTLLAGGTVISLRRSAPALIASAVERHRATVITGVTTIFAKLVKYLEDRESADLSSLRFAVSGGEPRNEVAFQRFRDLVGVPVHDNFCSSECFPLITYDPFADPSPILGSAGRLVPGSELRIVSPVGADVPVGEVGEALARGTGLMLGYWNDAEETAAALTVDGWYRTKDLVRLDADGYVYVVGRLSDMIIRGGSNVSPAEVERVLRMHPAVRDATVIGLPDPVYGEEVVAAVVCAETHDFDAEGVRTFAKEQLASYKVPTRLVQVDHLPSNTTTGKVNRRQVAALIAEADPR
ncbi:class I adenylate-forming enzyme family protein [Streptomyces canus]|uniref:class I adenylate-forming enzyme family protein n=1 Tax=Streptomyces canus TaxID=58343 RepID=UPI0033D6C17F